VNLTTGASFGTYTVVSVLGAGGMGEVYRAHDSRLGRDVAIKVLRNDGAADPDRLRRFTLEARAVAALNHPNILTIYDVADVDGVPYMATELVEGETLAERLAGGPIPLADALGIAVQIVEGLAHAHDARIVHRDLKPRNVMLKPDGLVKILDFGLGKMLAPTSAPGVSTDSTLSTENTIAGTILGTAGYMSPEQVTGKTVDGRADQFAFGAVLYEMLTGQRAFNRDTTIETISSVLSDEPKPVAAISPATPAALAAVVERCLSKNPADRYASTRDLAHDLETIRRDLVGSRHSSILVRPIPRRRLMAIAAVLAVVVVAGLATLMLMRRPSGPVQQIAVLPFTNIQRDPGNDAFADGIVELLTTNLTQLEKTSETLRVVPASDVRRYGVVSAKEARQTFGATLVVSGSIQRTADVVRLTLNLIDSATQQQRNARVIDAKADNPLALQDQAFAVLASMLGAGVEPTTRAALQTGSTLVPGAYDFYVQGRGYLQRYERLDNVDNAINLFRRAIEADERFALAHASLGEALWRKYELTKDAALIADARAACAKATAINDQTAPAHLTLSMIARGTGEYETAALEARRAIELDPMGSDGRRELARAYESLGLFVEAEKTYKDAIAARPGDWSGYNALGAFYSARKRNEDASAQFRRVIELTPDNARGYSNLGAIYMLLGRYPESAAALERSVSIRPSAAGFSNLGTVRFNQERYSDGARMFEKATELNGGDYRLWRNLAAAYYWAPGERARARAAYEKAVALAEQQREVNPRQAKLLADLADCYSMLGQAGKASELARQALAIDSADPSLLFTVGTAYEQAGDRAGAIDLISRALKAGYEAEAVNRAPGLSALRKDDRFLNSRLQ
jgi:serine/threonine protein kinase/tetratricopeptide (TPR) repeat protein